MAEHVLVDFAVLRRSDGSPDTDGLRLVLAVGTSTNIVLLVPGDRETELPRARAWLRENRLEEPAYVLSRTDDVVQRVVRTLRLRCTWCLTHDENLAAEALAAGIGALLAVPPVLPHADLGREHVLRSWGELVAERNRQTVTAARLAESAASAGAAQEN